MEMTRQWDKILREQKPKYKVQRIHRQPFNASR